MTMSDKLREVPVLGGNVAVGLVRIGTTVRRPATSSSTSVDALLQHLENAGFEGAPKALGYDEQGRQILSYVEGYVDASPLDLNVARLIEVGQLIRRFHDAASSFEAPPSAQWSVAIVPDSEELICHHDLAPWNLVRTSTSLTFIDFQGAGPGSRLWDLAYAAHGFVPLSRDAGLSDTQAATRLVALVDGYRLSEADRMSLVHLLAPRISAMYDLLRRGHETGEEPWATLWDQGHGQAWLSDAQYVQERTSLWAGALS
jgi:Ser/Thr protein kinase RdoA (MazF antagonist)